MHKSILALICILPGLIQAGCTTSSVPGDGHIVSIPGGSLSGNEVWSIRIPFVGARRGDSLNLEILDNRGNVLFSCTVTYNGSDYTLSYFGAGVSKTAVKSILNFGHRPRGGNYYLEVARIERQDFLTLCLRHWYDTDLYPFNSMIQYGSTNPLPSIDDIAELQLSLSGRMTVDFNDALAPGGVFVWQPTHKDVKMDSLADSLFTMTATPVDFLRFWSNATGNDSNGYTLTATPNGSEVKTWFTSRPVSGSNWNAEASVSAETSGTVSVAMTNNVYLGHQERYFDCKDRVRVDVQFTDSGTADVTFRANNALASNIVDNWATESTTNINTTGYNFLTVAYNLTASGVRARVLGNGTTQLASHTFTGETAIGDITWLAIAANNEGIPVTFSRVNTSWTQPNFDVAAFSRTVMDQMSDLWLRNTGPVNGWHIRPSVVHIWHRQTYIAAIMTWLDYLKLNPGANTAEIEKYTQVILNEANVVEAFKGNGFLGNSLVPGNDQVWASDDCGWVLSWFANQVEYTQDPDRKKYLLDAAWRLFEQITSRETLPGQAQPWVFTVSDRDDDILIWYHNTFGVDKQFTVVSSIGIAYAGMRLAALDPPRRTQYENIAIAVYNGMKNFMGRNDGLYWVVTEMNGSQGNFSPYGTMENGSFIWLTANMGMAALSLIHGDDEQAIQTLKGIARFEAKNGGYINDRDAWANGEFAGYFVKTIMESPVVPDYLKTIHANRFMATAHSISLDSTGFGILSANWYGSNVFHAPGSPFLPNEIMVNGTTSSIVVAALLAGILLNN